LTSWSRPGERGAALTKTRNPQSTSYRGFCRKVAGIPQATMARSDVNDSAGAPARSRPGPPRDLRGSSTPRGLRAATAIRTSAKVRPAVRRHPTRCCQTATRARARTRIGTGMGRAPGSIGNSSTTVLQARRGTHYDRQRGLFERTRGPPASASTGGMVETNDPLMHGPIPPPVAT